MDSEKHNDIENNIDDILKTLKDKFENQDAPLADLEGTGNGENENISPEEINERLIEKFIGNKKSSSKAGKSEYSIDESLMSEFIDEAESADEPETEELVEEEIAEEQTREENEEDTVSEIVEIVIPIIDAVSTDEENTEEAEEIEEIEEDGEDYADEDGQDGEDFYDEEIGNDAFVLFADDEVNDEDIFLEEEENEEIFAEDENESESKTDFVAESAEIPENESAEEAKDVDEDDEGDLPWYTDDELSKNKESIENTEEVIETAEEIEGATIILGIDEEEMNIDEDAPDEFEKALDEELEEPSSNEVVEETETAPQKEEEERPAYSLFGDKKEEPKNVADEEDSVSFYKTIISARAEREIQYGYPITEPSNVSDVYEGDIKGADIEPVDKAFDEISIDSIPSDSRDGEAFITLKNEDSEKVDDGDFYDTSEADEESQTEENEGEAQPVIEFEEDVAEEGENEERELSKIFKILKRVCMFALPLVILWLELMPILGIVPGGLLDYESFRPAYVLIDAQLLIFMAALNYEKLLDGLKKIISPAANFYSALSMTVLATLVGSILSCFCMTDDVPRLYNFISAFYLLVSYLLEYFERRRRREGTETLEKGDGVFTVRRSQGKNSLAEKMYAGGVDPDKSIFEPVEIEAESYYSAFSREKVEKNKNFSNSLIIGAITPAIIFGIIMAVVAIVFERGLYTAFNTFSFAVVATSPVSAMVAYYLPLHISHKRLSPRGCVIAGYESAAEIADCDALIFGDTHLFKECDAKEAGIKLFCDESKTRELFVCLACAYAKIGGPMKNTFSSVLGSESHKVSMIRITRNGFEAVIDNKNNLIVGSAEYLGRYGIYVEGARDNKEPGVIYVSLNSAISAKINVFYRTQPLFEALIEMLDSYAVRSVIETYDPMITGKYVARARDAFLSPVSVVHKNINDYKAEGKTKCKSPLSRFGVFATASRLKLVELICFCKSLVRIRRLNNCILIGAYIFSGLLCTFLVINGAITSANMLWVLFYQLALTGIYAFSAIKLLPLSFEGMQEKRKREERRKQERENKERYE